MGRWRNLAVMLAVIVAAVAIYQYLYLPQQKPGSQEGAALSDAWKSEGFDRQTLHSDFDELTALSESKLNKIKSNLQESIGLLPDAASKELAGVYVSLIDVAIKSREIKELNNGVDSGEPVCSNVATFKLINSKREQLLESVNSFNLAIDSFTQKFPEEAAEINLNRLGASFEEAGSNLEEDNELLALIEAEC